MKDCKYLHDVCDSYKKNTAAKLEILQRFHFLPNFIINGFFLKRCKVLLLLLLLSPLEFLEIHVPFKYYN